MRKLIRYLKFLYNLKKTSTLLTKELNYGLIKNPIYSEQYLNGFSQRDKIIKVTIKLKIGRDPCHSGWGRIGVVFHQLQSNAHIRWFMSFKEYYNTYN